MTQARSILVAVLVVGLSAGGGLAACAAKARPATDPAPSAMGGLDHRGGGHDPTIEALDAEIARDLDAMGLPAPSDAELTALMAGDATPLPMAGEASSTCEAPPADRCSDVCTLATSICGNARNICEVAEDLPGDDWAAERCASGKDSCRRASERCCGC